MTLSDILTRFANVKGSAGQFTARCPTHDDKQNSLSISEGEKGIVMFCHAGCATEDIVAAVGLHMEELFNEKKFPPADRSGKREIEKVYSYVDLAGKLIHQTIRYKGKAFSQRRPDPNNHGKYIYNLKDITPILYNLSAIAEAETAGKPLYIVEGEKDADNLINLGFPATTSPMGAGKWKDSFSDYLIGADVMIVPDNDEAGKNHAEVVAKSLQGKAKSISICDLAKALPNFPDHGDVSDFINMVDASERETRLQQLFANATPYQPTHNNTWTELTPLDACEPLPSFPLEALPPATAEYINAVAETVQAPLEMAAACGLGVLQISCRGRYPVCLPSGHIETPSLYIAPVAAPSERKSGVISVTTKPLIEFESEYNKTHAAELNQNKSELKLLQGRIANAENQAVKAKEPEQRREAMDELQELNEDLAMFVVMELLRLFGADVTPEKLAAMLKSQGSVFALISAEGGGIFENIGRYSDKGGMEIYLNGFSGDRVCIDRKNSDSIVIDNPVLSIIAPCQPSVINDLFSDKQKSGRGLLSRILFVKCTSRVGTRKAISESMNERIASNFNNLCHTALATTSKGNLLFDGNSFKIYEEFFNDIEKRLTPEGDLAISPELSQWANKLPGQMARLAGLMHCVSAFEQGRDPLLSKISSQETNAAVELAKFFLAHAKNVYLEESEPESIRNAKYLWERIKSIKSSKIAKRELIRKTQGKTDFVLDESLTVLVERGYIRIERTNGGTPGRPGETIFINPETENLMTKLSKTPTNYLDILDNENPPIVLPFGFSELTDEEIGNLPF